MRSLEYLFVIIVFAVVFLGIYLKSPTVVGAAGERQVNALLSRKFTEPDYILIEDLTLPSGHGTTQVDHIILSRFGIFIVETKNMSGWIFGNENQVRWTQVLHRHKSQFQNPLRQNYHHLKVVQNLLGVRLDQMENLVAFVGSAVPKTDMPPNVFWSKGALSNYLAAQKTVRFTEKEIRRFAQKLRSSALNANAETRRSHIHYIQQKVVQKQNDLTKCPRCGSQMIQRTNRKSGNTFYGCSRYPNCRGTRQA